jgi:phage-related holin
MKINMKTLSFLEKSVDVIAVSAKETTALGVGVAGVFSAIIAFVVQSWQINLFLFIILLFLIAVNTWSGVRNAKKQGAFDMKVLKDSIISKCIGYFILIIAVSLIVIMFFLASLRDGMLMFPEYYLNIIVMTTFVGLGIFEAKSILENLRENGTPVPKFLDNIIDKAETKINDLTK